MQTSKKIRRKFLKYCLQTGNVITFLSMLPLFSKVGLANAQAGNANKDSTSSKSTANAVQDRLAQAQQTVSNRQQAGSIILAPDTRQGFSLTSLTKTIEAFTAGNHQTSSLILLSRTADQMSDGRRTNVSISTKLPDVRKIVILFSANPNITAAVYEFTNSLLPTLDLTIKMRQTGDLIVLVESQNKWYLAQKSIKVLLGGCG